MPPKRTMEDVDEEGDEEESIQQIKIVRREDLMCEICSRILKLVGKYKGQRSKASFDLWNLKSLKLRNKLRKKGKDRYW